MVPGVGDLVPRCKSQPVRSVRPLANQIGDRRRLRPRASSDALRGVCRPSPYTLPRLERRRRRTRSSSASTSFGDGTLDAKIYNSIARHGALGECRDIAASKQRLTPADVGSDCSRALLARSVPLGSLTPVAFLLIAWSDEAPQRLHRTTALDRASNVGDTVRDVHSDFADSWRDFSLCAGADARRGGTIRRGDRSARA